MSDDLSGTPRTSRTIDPTENVKALVALEVKRLDDLRQLTTDNSKELRSAESRRIDEQAHLRAAYDQKLQDAEAKRIDAIRAVDVNAVSVANERATAQAAVLASQVTASADTLRTLVATTASQNAQSQSVQYQQLADRLAALERSSYEGQGKSSYTDPALVALLTEVKTLSAARSVSTGTGLGAATVVAYAFGAIGALGGVIAIVVVLTQ